MPDNGPWSRTLRKSADGVWLQWWGYSPRPDGTTQSSTCGVCYHIYNARIKARKITIKEWRQELGNSKELLDGHQALADVCCQKIADKNGCFRSHVDWATADVEALVLVRAMRVKKTKPGFAWQPKWYRSPSPLLVAFFRSSDDSFGSLCQRVFGFFFKFLSRLLRQFSRLDHCQQSQLTQWYYDYVYGPLDQDRRNRGHREFWEDGEEGVIIPDAPVTRIEFSEIQEARLEQRHDPSKESLLDPKDLQNNMVNYANSFLPGLSNFSGNSNMLADFDPESSEATGNVRQPGALAQGLPPTAAMAAMAQGQPLGTPLSPTASAAPLSPQAPMPPPPTAQTGAKAGAKASAKAGSTNLQLPADPTATSSTSTGRTEGKGIQRAEAQTLRRNGGH